jgi:polyisoprenoid-binding protein YceI
MNRVKLAAALTGCTFALCGAAGAEPVRYDFNKTHTAIRASWNHWGLSRQSIEFTKYDGTLMLDLEKPANSSVEVTFSLVDGFWVGAPENDRFEQHLASPDLFDLAQFTTATFKATSFETKDGKTGTMRGDLTIKGQTHPVALDVKLNRAGPLHGKLKAGFSASGKINRSQWGLGFGAPDVSDELEITVETELDGPAVAQ